MDVQKIFVVLSLALPSCTPPAPTALPADTGGSEPQPAPRQPSASTPLAPPDAGRETVDSSVADAATDADGTDAATVRRELPVFTAVHGDGSRTSWVAVLARGASGVHVYHIDPQGRTTRAEHRSFSGQSRPLSEPAIPAQLVGRLTPPKTMSGWVVAGQPIVAALNELCDDVWCEGPQKLRFRSFACDQPTMSCTVRFSLQRETGPREDVRCVAYAEPPATELGSREPMLEDLVKDRAATPILIDRISTCVDAVIEGD